MMLMNALFQLFGCKFKGEKLDEVYNILRGHLMLQTRCMVLYICVFAMAVRSLMFRSHVDVILTDLFPECVHLSMRGWHLFNKVVEASNGTLRPTATEPRHSH